MSEIDAIRAQRDAQRERELTSPKHGIGHALLRGAEVWAGMSAVEALSTGDVGESFNPAPKLPATATRAVKWLFALSIVIAIAIVALPAGFIFYQAFWG